MEFKLAFTFLLSGYAVTNSMISDDHYISLCCGGHLDESTMPNTYEGLGLSSKTCNGIRSLKSTTKVTIEPHFCLLNTTGFVEQDYIITSREMLQAEWSILTEDGQLDSVIWIPGVLLKQDDKMIEIVGRVDETVVVKYEGKLGQYSIVQMYNDGWRRYIPLDQLN